MLRTQRRLETAVVFTSNTHRISAAVIRWRSDNRLEVPGSGRWFARPGPPGARGADPVVAGPGFDVDQVRNTLSPILLPANRIFGDDGTLVSARDVANASGVPLELIQRLHRAVGLAVVD